MNAIQTLATQPWVGRLGMTLLHFLWQGAIIVAIYAAARTWGARSLGPNGRYLLASAALAAMAMVPVATASRRPELKPRALQNVMMTPRSAGPLSGCSLRETFCAAVSLRERDRIMKRTRRR